MKCGHLPIHFLLTIIKAKILSMSITSQEAVDATLSSVKLHIISAEETGMSGERYFKTSAPRMTSNAGNPKTARFTIYDVVIRKQ